MTKICTKCKKEKDSFMFYKNKNHKDGLCSECKQCKCKLTLLWAEKNPEKMRLADKKWKSNNKEKIKNRDSEYYKNNRNKKLENSKRWVINNPVKNAENKKVWRKNNLERVKNKRKEWERNNPDKMYVINKNHKKKRRALKLNAEGSHTEQEWQDKKKEYCYRCAYCGIYESKLKDRYKYKVWWKLTEDHIKALTKGGSDYIQNIIPACISCNDKKNNREYLKINNINI